MKLIFRLQLILGLWIFASPWILGYSFVTPALWSGIIVGTLVFILALWGLFGDLQSGASTASQPPEQKEDHNNPSR